MFHRILRPAIALATAATLVGGVGYAAAASAPGSALYGLKRSVAAAVATVQRTFTPLVPAAHAPASLPDDAPGGRIPSTDAARETPAAPKAEPRGSAGSPGASKAATPSKQGGPASTDPVKETGAGRPKGDNGKRGSSAAPSPETTHGQEQRTVPEKRGAKPEKSVGKNR